MLFAQRFNEIIKSGGKKQIELTEYCYVTKQSISDFKQGKSFPTLETLFNIRKFFDCSSDYLLGLTDSDKN